MNDKTKVKLPHKSLQKKLFYNGYKCKMFKDINMINNRVYNGIMKSSDVTIKTEFIIWLDDDRNILIEVSKMDLDFSTIINNYYGDRGYNIIYSINNHLVDKARPYNKEKMDLKANVDFGSISKYIAKRYLNEFKDREHKEALKINKEMN